MEDLAGNNLRGAFDRDRESGDTLRTAFAAPIRLPFTPDAVYQAGARGGDRSASPTLSQ
jgi:hypothetical protein